MVGKSQPSSVYRRHVWEKNAGEDVSVDIFVSARVLSYQTDSRHRKYD